MSSTNQSSNTSSNFSANSSSASHAAAEHTKKSLHEDSTHGTQHEARDKPEHEFGSTGKSITTQKDLTKPVDEE